MLIVNETLSENIRPQHRHQHVYVISEERIEGFFLIAKRRS